MKNILALLALAGICFWVSQPVLMAQTESSTTTTETTTTATEEAETPAVVEKETVTTTSETTDVNPAAAAAAATVMLVFAGVALIIVLLMIISLWKVFAKAGKPGWAAIIPIYNIIVLCQVAGKPAWWVILFLIPVVSLVISILVSLGIAQSFGKSSLFGIGLWLLPFIFFPILAFSDAKYQAA
ncbi:MAG: DUF5684 domain-containing protein [Verrucomicrobiae bacterium]|nr:DUF5684 domain-containing protein [Verrucomicrobiae bacterium]